MKNIILKISILSLIILPFTSFAHQDIKEVNLPKVFLIGDFADEFEEVSKEYKTQLLEVCEYDMSRAYFKWLVMLQEMEDMAESIDFDIKGVKMWLKVFWNEDGTIAHLAYFLKPRSRNINKDELTAFLYTFVDQYSFPLEAEQKFSHYGNASFPVVGRRKIDQESN